MEGRLMPSFAMKKPSGKWGIVHAGRFLVQNFDTKEEAEDWELVNVDDQMFDSPNSLSAPLEYES